MYVLKYMHTYNNLAKSSINKKYFIIAIFTLLIISFSLLFFFFSFQPKLQPLDKLGYECGNEICKDYVSYNYNYETHECICYKQDIRSSYNGGTLRKYMKVLK